MKSVLFQRTAMPRPTNNAKPSAGREVLLFGRDLVFNTLLRHISEAVAKRSPQSEASYREHFLKEALKMKLPSDCAAKLVSWAKSGAPMSSITGPDEELHKIINTAFVWMCAKFGPVYADKILLQAVTLTEQLPESFDNSPRDFL